MKKIVIITILNTVITSASFAQTNFNQYSSSVLLNNFGNVTGGGAIINSHNNRENTKGTRFLFNSWVKGNVTKTEGSIIDIDSFRYNFDKLSDNLLVTQDENQFVSVDANQIKDFKLTSGDKTYDFERINVIDSSKLLLALVKSSDKYSLYKYIKTKFVKADYNTNGITESGHQYDEFVDANAYYILMPGGNTYKEIITKEKSLKAAFAADKSKLFDYIGTHNEDTIDENYLIDLVNYLNN